MEKQIRRKNREKQQLDIKSTSRGERLRERDKREKER